MKILKSVFIKGKFLRKVVLLLAVSLIIPVLVTLSSFKFVENTSAWIGYWGSIIGGVLGGCFTLIGVIFAFTLEKEKSYIEQLPDKIVNIQAIKEIVLKHKFKIISLQSLGSQREFEQVVEDVEEKVDMLFRDIDVFNSDKESLFFKASKVDTDVFNAIQSYCYSLEIIKMNIKRLKTPDIDSVNNLYREITNAKGFQKDILNTLKEILEEKEEYYLNYLYNNGKSKIIIDKFNDHSYLKNIKK